MMYWHFVFAFTHTHSHPAFCVMQNPPREGANKAIEAGADDAIEDESKV